MKRAINVLRVLKRPRASFCTTPDHFATFGVMRQFDVDDGDLSTRFKSLQAQWHPDRHENSAESVEKSAHINAAYDTLRKAHKRAKHLIELEYSEQAIGDTCNESEDAEFLLWMMNIRENLDQMIQVKDEGELSKIRQVISKHYQQCLKDTADAFARGNITDIQRLANRLQYFASVQLVFDNL